ncbi:NLP/P60 protein [Enterobacter hormaechei]|nr:NLP/P60 protein [Enterobacter hormaechei]
MRDKTVSAILAHAAASFPEECCGVVIQKGRVEKYIPCKNNAESPTEQFELNPEDYAAAKSRALWWRSSTAIPATGNNSA